MTINQRKKQLETRKEIACGFATIAMLGVFLGGIFWVAHNADEGIDEAITTEEATEVFAEAEPTEITLAWVDTPIVELGTEAPATEEVAVVETETEEETEEVEVPEVTYSVDDLERLAHLIWCEAGNAGDTAMIYTGSVVLNRRDSKRFPNTIKGVIAEPHQYGVARYYMSRKPSKRAYEIAQDLLENGSQLPADIVAQASAKQYRKYGKRLYAKIGKIYFFSIKG